MRDHGSSLGMAVESGKYRQKARRPGDVNCQASGMLRSTSAKVPLTREMTRVIETFLAHTKVRTNDTSCPCYVLVYVHIVVC